MKKIIVSLFAVVVIVFSWASPVLSQGCPYFAMVTPKDNHLFLYFPTFSDSIFPEWGTPYGIDTSPVGPFDVANLDPGIGTTDQLRQRIFEMVTEDYCEFNVEVHMMTLGMSPVASNWQVVGIGSDSETYGTGVLFGIAQNVDLNDSDPQDYARVYADSFSLAYPAQFSGVNSTLERWANAISHTATHEAGHNYGLAHEDAYPRPGSGEDGVNNHIMATGSSGLTGEQRASLNRHFGDIEYSILGHNVGLNTNTIHNWDFTNPNNQNACSMRFKVLSTATTLTINWYYTGSMSPWIDPFVTPTGTTEVYHGTTYNVFYVTFSVAQTWANGPAGVVPPGVQFHIGSTFAQSNGIIIKETTLFNCTGTILPLSPRIIGYDAGTLDLGTGNFRMSFFNPDPARPLIIRNLRIQRVPRMIDINTMMRDQRAVGLRNMPINPISTTRFDSDIIVKDQAVIPIANLMDKRFVDINYDSRDCKKGFNTTTTAATSNTTLDVSEGEIEYCPQGTALSLFPSSYVYVVATVVDPEACFWDAKEKRFITGPQETTIFYQFSGFVPDFNKNGEDDLLDIRTNSTSDENKNGVPDDVEAKLRNEKSSMISTLNR